LMDAPAPRLSFGRSDVDPRAACRASRILARERHAGRRRRRQREKLMGRGKPDHVIQSAVTDAAGRMKQIAAYRACPCQVGVERDGRREGRTPRRLGKISGKVAGPAPHRTTAASSSRPRFGSGTAEINMNVAFACPAPCIPSRGRRCRRSRSDHPSGSRERDDVVATYEGHRALAFDGFQGLVERVLVGDEFIVPDVTRPLRVHDLKCPGLVAFELVDFDAEGVPAQNWR